MDPSVDAPRASPIASISLGTVRQFGLRRHGSDSIDVVRLAHGSLCIMENACQFLYKHSLMPEKGAAGVRVNLTFRSKRPVKPGSSSSSRGSSGSSQATQGMPPSPPSTTAASAQPPAPLPPHAGTVCVGLATGVEQKPAGWKDKLHHPFESPFIDDTPDVAAARYASWLGAQPVFMAWIREQLVGKFLVASSSSSSSSNNTATAIKDHDGADSSGSPFAAHDEAHANMLAALVSTSAAAADEEFEAAAAALEPEAAVGVGELRIGNLQALRQKQKTSAAAAGTPPLHGGRRDASKMPCRDFAKGKCTRGVSCRFSHDNTGPEGFAAVCVDRSTVLGNPFKMGSDGHDDSLRDAVCDAYADLLAAPSGADPTAIGNLHGVAVDPRFADAAKSERARTIALCQLKSRLLRGESLRLLCWCAPRRCHAETIAKWLTGTT